MRDEADFALRDVTEAQASWLPGHEEFITPDYLAQKSLTQIACYREDVDAMATAMQPLLKRFDRSLLRTAPIVRIESSALRGHLALVRAARAKKEGRAADLRAHLSTPRHFIAVLARGRSRYAHDDLQRLHASYVYLTEPTKNVVPCLRQLHDAVKPSYPHLAAAAAKALAPLVGADEGAALCAEAAAYAEVEGIVRPDAFFQVWFAGPTHPGW